MVNFCCDEEFYWDEEPASGFCIFHDKDYLHDKTNYEEHKRKVRDRLKHKVNHAISNNEPLLCIGFQLPDFSLSDLGVSKKEFTKPVYFNGSQFFGKVDFSDANFPVRIAIFSSTHFEGKADFHGANFKGEALFDHSEFYGKTHFSGKFNGKTNFNYVLFEGKEKVIFGIVNLSNVSLALLRIISPFLISLSA
jgi:uncharacterized protein YjbI with pentapeptide repeats